MRILTSLWSRLFRKDRDATAEYEAEVMFAGWVDLPPLFRQVGTSPPYEVEDPAGSGGETERGSMQRMFRGKLVSA